MPAYDEEGDSSFTGKLKGFYYKLEDKYYALLDNLHEKGIDLYKYFVEPIESKGIPSFPVACALLLVILGAVVYGVSFFAAPQTTALTVRVSGGNFSSVPVTLLLDDAEFATSQTVNGVAVFNNVPLNKQAKVRVDPPGLPPVFKTISLSGPATTVDVRLSSTPVETHDFLVNVVDASTENPIRDASIRFESLSTGVAGVVTTQPDGTAVITLDSLDTILSLNVEAENFEASQRSTQANVGQLTIQLVPRTGNRDNGGDQPQRGTVIVRVTDDQGNPVNASIDLFEENTSTPLASDNVESGVARFEDVAPVGTRVYAVVRPISEEFLQKQTTISELVLDAPLEFSVQLERSTASTSQVLLITVKDDVGVAVPSANVLVYIADSNQLIDTKLSDETGKAQFILSNSLDLTNLYVAVNGEGFLPLISTISSRDTAIELQRLVAGNNVEFDAEVLDADGGPASGAVVELADESGRLFGLSQLTGPTGTATFSSAPAATLLRLFASLGGSSGQSDVFEVPFSESGERRVTFSLERPLGAILITVKDLIDSTPVQGSLVTVHADSIDGYAVSNCTTVTDGTCLLEKVWANKDLFIIAEAEGYASFQSSRQFVSPHETKQLTAMLLSNSFNDQTVVNLISLVDDKGRDITNAPAIEKGRTYTARFAASFANGSNQQGIFLRVGDQPTTVSDAVVIKGFEFTPSAIGAPLAFHSTTYSPGSDCSVDLLNNDVNNEGKKWAEVDYNSVSGVVELTARVFVKPTADPTQDKLSFHYRAFAVQNGKYSRSPVDDELKLERRTQAKDSCYAATIDKEFALVEGSNVCNDAGTACIAVSFSSTSQPQPVGSPFIATINQPFQLNFEIRNFGPLEGASAYAKIVSKINGLAKLSDYSGQGVASLDETRSTNRVLFGQSQEIYTGGVTVTGSIPADYVPFEVEFGDSRGAIATHSRSFAVVQGTGALVLQQLTPTEFEVGKARDLKITVQTTSGQPITDATISFDEESGSPFDGDVPPQIAGDNTPGNGESGQYTIKRVRTKAPGTFRVTASRDRFVPVSETLTSKVASFFEFDQPDFISLSCNATSLRVTNTLDVEVNADVFVDPACVSVSGPGINQVASQGGQSGTAHYRIPSFKPSRTRILTLTPNSNASCQVEISATDPRTGTRSSDDPIQIENTCTALASTANVTNADGIVHINGNVFQPPRLKVDTFSYLFYGSFQPPSFDDSYSFAETYASPPYGGYAGFASRAGLVDPTTGNVLPQYVDSRYQGAAGVPRDIAYGASFPGQYGYGSFAPGQPGQYGAFGAPEGYGTGAFFDIRRANVRRNWTISWINEDPVPHSFICSDRSENTVVQVNSLQPGQVYSKVFDKPGLYKCVLENTNQGTIKIKSMCPKKGATYYTRLVTACMLRKATADSGLFDGGKQHAARVATTVKTKFTVFGSQITVSQDSDKASKVDCRGSTGGAECTIKITPLVPRNGFGFAIYDATGTPNYVTRIKPEGTVDPSCFTFTELNKDTSYRAALAPVISTISATGLTSAPRVASFAIKFNEKGNCVKLRPEAGGSGKVNFKPIVWNPSRNQFIETPYALFELQSNTNPNLRYSIKLNIEPTLLLDGRYLFTTVPTTVGENKLFYRTKADGDPKEPGFVINNLPETVGMFKNPTDGETLAVRSLPGSIGILDGNEPPSDKLNSIGRMKDGFYVCAFDGGCQQEGGKAIPVKPFIAEARDTGDLGGQLGDVIGNYKFEPNSAPGELTSEDDKAFTCSGTNYCTRTTEAQAVEIAQRRVEAQLKEQYAYVETFNLDSTMDNLQDGLADCIASALATMAAQEAQYQMCKTLANFCSQQNYIDPEEEEIEEGESFAAGVSLDSILGDSKTIISDIICQETEFGQNLQALRNCMQPGNRVCRDRIAARIAGNLRQTEIKSVAKEIPIVTIPEKTSVHLVTKRIQDNPEAAKASIGTGIAIGGYNVYEFSVSPSQLVGSEGDKARSEGTVIFEVRPPGYDLSKAVSALSTGLAAAAFAPVRLPGAIYDWATNTEQTPDSNKIRSLLRGFPYVVLADDKKTTTVDFDRFQPTLLTLNKYPMMRAVTIKQREKTDALAGNAVTSNACTVAARPVDPLQLFDACEDIRGDIAQAAYDNKPTSEKAPFAKSLVFQAVPAGKGNALQPVWPADYSQGSFAVAIPPKYEFVYKSRQIEGVSGPAIGRIPGIGSVFDPAGNVPNSFKDISIPASDIKRYAVQVTSCQYAVPADGKITFAEPRDKNCNEPVAGMFPGSSGTTLVIDSLSAGNQCVASEACIALRLEGNHLAVATLGEFSTSGKIADAARDLLRYYTDESYEAKQFAEAVKTHNCKVAASATAVLARCSQGVEGSFVPAAPSTPPASSYTLLFEFPPVFANALNAIPASTTDTREAAIRETAFKIQLKPEVTVQCAGTPSFEYKEFLWLYRKKGSSYEASIVGASVTSPASFSLCTAKFSAPTEPEGTAALCTSTATLEGGRIVGFSNWNCGGSPAPAASGTASQAPKACNVERRAFFLDRGTKMSLFFADDDDYPTRASVEVYAGLTRVSSASLTPSNRQVVADVAPGTANVKVSVLDSSTRNKFCESQIDTSLGQCRDVSIDTSGREVSLAGSGITNQPGVLYNGNTYVFDSGSRVLNGLNPPISSPIYLLNPPTRSGSQFINCQISP